MNDLGLAPSEVRQITLGEIWGILWARERVNQPQDHYEELYQQLLGKKGL